MGNIEEFEIDCNLSKPAFKISLSFEFLINDIEKISLTEAHPMHYSAKEIMKKLDAVPEMKKPITGRTLLQKNKSLVQQMMSFVISPLNDNVDISAVFPPFEPDYIHSTQLFKDVIEGEHRKIEIAKEVGQKKELISIIYYAYLIILEKIYGFDLHFDMPTSLKLTDDKDNSIKFFSVKVNSNYLKVRTLGKVEKLTENELKDLFDNLNDLDYWNKKIPLDKFEFSGFLKFDYTNTTHDYVISQLKSDLLDKNTIITNEGFDKIGKKIKALVENPNVEFGLAATFDFESNLNKNLVWKTIVPQSDLKCEEYAGTVYEKAFVEKQIVLTDDFEELEKDKVVDAFLSKGFRSHAVAPLVLEGEVVGMLEFACKKPRELNMMQIQRLFELFPMFAIALKRSKEEWDVKVRAIIQEEFTAIHPTVEWRFQEAATELLNANPEEQVVGREPIVFSDVVPIYGASDIRNSSIERNIAIQEDLTAQLEHAQKIMGKEIRLREIPLLNDLTHKIKVHLQKVKVGLKAGDEVSVLEFLKKEIDPVLVLLKERYKEMKEPVNEYFKRLDPELGVLYKKRKDFEDSLTLINDKVVDIIDREQSKAQEFFPHYFEKYRTDGVEYNGYLGQSLVKELKYSDIYLKNIRLWQLMVKVKIARKIRQLQPTLKTKLDITQLILVHSNPLSIAFRQDEKKFDVAGAYNIRYEITKKRIDKALIKGTNERVTQVGKIAIIYSYADEIEEYKRYIGYMVSQGYLTGAIEELELEDLKGASGLRALRVEVNFCVEKNTEINSVEIKRVVREKV